MEKDWEKSEREWQAFIGNREEAIAWLKHIGLTREEAERILAADRAMREKLIQKAIARLKGEAREESWMPMPIGEGPPLPRRFGIRWPWEE